MSSALRFFGFDLNDDNDMYLDNSNRFAVVSGVDLIAQRIQNRLSTWTTEYQLDTSWGTAYYENILAQAKQVSLNVARNTMLDVIESVPGVDSVLPESNVSFDNSTRVLTGTYYVQAVEEEIVLTFAIDASGPSGFTTVIRPARILTGLK